MSDYTTQALDLPKDFNILLGIKYGYQIPELEERLKMDILKCQRKLAVLKELRLKYKIKKKAMVKPIQLLNSDYKW